MTPATPLLAGAELARVDEQHQPRYLTRAAELERSILRVTVIAGMTAKDIPGVHGLCVAAARTSERRQ